MTRVIFKTADGSETVVDGTDGYTVMEAATDNGVDAVVAECGGACACATCHVYIDPEWLAKLPPMDDMEDAMLDAAMDRRENSRLSCQIEIKPELDGLIAIVADNNA